MASHKHEGTLGHNIGRSILGHDQPPGTSKVTQVNVKDTADPQAQNRPSQSDFKHMSIEKHANGGFTVSHTTAAKDGSSFGEGSKEQSNAFTSASDAHAHIGNLMDCPGCSGSTQVRAK